MSTTEEKKESKQVVKLRGKRKQYKLAEKGRIYISASFNNTLCAVTDEKGDMICWGSAGAAGFRGARKSTPFAATTSVDATLRRAIENHKLKEVEIYVKGPGAGRDAALRAIKTLGLKITKIADITPIAHNGPRPKKKRRV